MVAHALVIINNKSSARASLASSHKSGDFHDMSEILTGDLPTPGEILQ